MLLWPREDPRALGPRRVASWSNITQDPGIKSPKPISGIGANVRYWTKVDKDGFRSAVVCPLKTGTRTVADDVRYGTKRT